MSLSSAPKKSRGPYRSLRPTPRQTLYNRKRRRTMVTAQDTVPQCNEASAARDDEPLLETDTQPESGVMTEIAADECAVVDQPSLPVSVDICSSQPPLFPGSLLTSGTSHLLIESFANRHHLSSQGKEDLLRLLHLHLPSDNLLPQSLYAFRKVSNPLNDITPEPTEHFYCPRCYSPLQTSESTFCPNQYCGSSLLPQSIPSFTTLSVSLQLQVLVKRKFLY